MKLAIIGANGFIGTRIVEQFHLKRLHEVVPIVRKPSSLALPARFAVDWRLGDALDVASLTKALEGCEAVVHAAIGDPRQIEAMPGILCQAAQSAGIWRVVYLSSASVHGQAPEPGTTEKSPLHTKHAMEYNSAKVVAEQAFFRDCTKHGLHGFALRPGVVFGPRSRWIADLAQELRTGTAWLYRDGAGLCNSIYVDNLVHAIQCALLAPESSAGPYLVGDAETVTWREFYERVAGGLGIDPAGIHRIDTLPTFEKSLKDKVQDAVAHPAVQSLLPAVPGKWKQMTKAVLAASAQRPPPDSWTLPPRPAPHITQEMALLQQCRWRFPNDEAQRRLSYAPRVAFADGVQRSLAWLAFAEGRQP